MLPKPVGVLVPVFTTGVRKMRNEKFWLVTVLGLPIHGPIEYEGTELLLT